MPLPTGRPDRVIAAIREGFRKGCTVWPKAVTADEAHSQWLGVKLNYLIETSGGFALTDLGRNETKMS